MAARCAGIDALGNHDAADENDGVKKREDKNHVDRSRRSRCRRSLRDSRRQPRRAGRTMVDGDGHVIFPVRFGLNGIRTGRRERTSTIFGLAYLMYPNVVMFSGRLYGFLGARTGSAKTTTVRRLRAR